MEKRKLSPIKTKATPLPVDYIKVVENILSTNFGDALGALSQIKKAPASFRVGGEIHVDEVLFFVSIVHDGQLAATTIYASTDFDPKASAPNAQDLLGNCLDAVGTLLEELFSTKNPKRFEQLASNSLSALENVPFEWTELKIERTRVFLKIDKSNPLIDQLTEEWTAKNDPEFQKKLEEEEAQTSELFVTGPKKGTLH